MTDEHESQKHVRAGIFESPDKVEEVLPKLRAAGFGVDQISIFTSDPELQERFRPYLDESVEESENDSKMSTVGKASLGLGGAAAIATMVTSAGTSIFVIGAFSGIAVLGTFVALMLSRGVKKETADFYEQEIQAGRILVVVGADDNDSDDQLARAEETLLQHGASSFELQTE